MKTWLKKYSIQVSILTAILGAIVMVLPYFGAVLPQHVIGILMFICGVLGGIGRVIPQITK